MSSHVPCLRRGGRLGRKHGCLAEASLGLAGARSHSGFRVTSPPRLWSLAPHLDRMSTCVFAGWGIPARSSRTRTSTKTDFRYQLGALSTASIVLRGTLGHMQMIEEIECPTRAIKGHAPTCQILNNGATALGATAAGFGAPFFFRPYQEV